MKLKIPDYISAIKPYVAGKPTDAVEREYGIKDAVKLASNENPLGPSPKAVEAIRQALDDLHRYPDAGGYYLTRAVAEKFHIDPTSIVLGNGSDDIIALLAAVLLRPSDEVILPQPSFLFYEIALRSMGAKPVWVPLRSFKTDLAVMVAKISPKTRMIFLNVPHNPAGTIISKFEFENFIAQVPPDVVTVLDEAYIEFVKDVDCTNSFDFLSGDQTIVGMRTFSKAYGLAGIRVGYGVMPPFLAELLHRVRQPFNVNVLAQVAATAALEDSGFLHETLQLVHTERELMYSTLDKLDVPYVRSEANFFMIDVGSRGKSADDIFEKLLPRGIIVRSMTSYGYPQHIRVNIGKPEENIRFLDALKQVL